MSATRLRTRRVQKPWGRRDLGPGFGDVSEDGAPVGEIWFEHPTEPDPELLVKYLFTSERLSIQVHPDDRAAAARGHRRGKDEAWVVLAAEPHAELGLGLVSELDPEALRRAALDGSIERLLDWRPVRSGDVFYSPAGTIHAIGPGLRLVEVQQNLDLTFRLYDYGRPRELHLEEGLEVSRPAPCLETCRAREVDRGRRVLVEGRAFVLERWTGAGRRRFAAGGRPALLVPLAGDARLADRRLAPGEVWCADGEVELVLDEASELLVAYPGADVAPG